LFQREIEALEGYIKLYGHAVVPLIGALHYRKVAGSIPNVFICIFRFFRPHYGPWFDSVSDRYEYQEYFLGDKGGRCVVLIYRLHLPNVFMSGIVKLLETLEPVKACIGISVPFTVHITNQSFSTFVRPRPGKYFLHKTRARFEQVYSSVPFQFF